MIEYETTKPLLISFNQIFEYGRLHNEYNLSLIIKDALKKFSSKTILQAVKGLDKRSRMLFMQSLPIKIADEVNDNIESTHFFSSSDSLKAQQKILNAINRTYDKDKGKFAEVLID
jgi:flagellar motor switch protein FliG